MKHLVARVALCSALLVPCPGCKILLETNVEKQPVQAPPMKVTEQVAPVQPEGITPANAHSKAKQLLEEIENDSRQ